MDMGKYSSYILFLLLAVFVAILYANGFGPLDHAQRSLNDLLCRTTAEDGVRADIAIVQVDARSEQKYGDWPWSRDLVADLVAATGAGEPKAVVVDLDLSEDADQDSAGYTGILAGQISWINNVVLPYDIALSTFRSGATSYPDYLFNYSVAVDNPLGLMDENASLIARKVFLPAEKLLESKPYLGFDYVQLDDDRTVRYQPLLVNYEGYYYPSLSLIASAAYLGVKTTDIHVIEGKEIQLGSNTVIPINGHSDYFVDFPPEGSFQTYSAASILSDDFNRGVLKNRLVIIGLDRATDRESYRTPLQKQASRLEILAAASENIMNHNFLQLNNHQTGVNMLILLAVGALCAFLLPQVSLLYRFVILFGGLFLLVNVNYFLFSSFQVVPDTMYLYVELLLFAAVAPLLDSALIKGEEALEEEREANIKKAQKRAAQNSVPAEPPVHKIADEPDRANNQPTAVIEPSPAPVENAPIDHQAIDIDREFEETTATPSDGTDPDKSLGGAIISANEPIVADPAPEDFDSGAIELKDEPFDSGEIPAGDPYGDLSVGEDSGETSQMSASGGVPSNLGRYQITGKLGKGAMGLVYKGVDPAINRPVALKTIRLDFVNDPDEMKELKERLHREAQAAGKLSHPNIVTIYDVGSEGPLQYIAMEYLEGRTLEDMIKKKTKFNYRILSEIIIQICSALQYAHDQGIVHRDIKPANIMILRDYRVKVMDYGIARIDTSSMTKTGIAMGTPNYISPEQLKGQKSDHRADIFSLGVVMYEMLLGRRPFKGENITSLIYTIINQEPPRPSDVNPQIPLLFDHVIMKALKKDPTQRYQKATEIAVDLKDFVESFASNG